MPNKIVLSLSAISLSVVISFILKILALKNLNYTGLYINHYFEAKLLASLSTLSLLISPLWPRTFLYVTVSLLSVII